MQTSFAVLGIHKDPWHNTGASIVCEVNGVPEVVYIAEERLDRVKDSRAFPEKAIAACMKHVGLESFDQLDLVVMDYIVEHSDWERDYFKTPCRTDVFLRNFDKKKIKIINHHLAHAASAYYCSGYEESSVLVVDGRGSDKETQSLFQARGSDIELIESSDKIGIGLLYAAVTQLIGFGSLQEGKTMGLAPYGAPEIGVGEDRQRLIPIAGNFNGVAADYSNLCVDGTYELKIQIDVSSPEAKAQAAYEVQAECEREMLRLARYAKAKTGSQYLCIAGGVGLNSVANYKILKSGEHQGLFIQPASSDTGIALGAALWGYHSVLKRPLLNGSISPFLGPNYSTQDIDRLVEVPADLVVIDRDKSLELAADLLAGNFILGCVHGRSEMGPRALGNRSIIMSPLRPENKDILNSRVKFREAFRPFAPACMLEHVREYFDIDVPSPYMLLVPDVLPEKRAVIPAVTHVDGTGRLQTLTPELNPVFYKLAALFKVRTGVPVLLNTSFNVNGEPIVETPQDAMRCFMGTNIDALYLDDRLFLKKEAAEFLFG
jgi:carbamoyltransferase